MWGKKQKQQYHLELKLFMCVYTTNAVVAEVLRRPYIATLIVQHLQESHCVVIRYAHDRMSVEVLCCCTDEVFPFAELSVYRYVILTQRIIVSTIELCCYVPAD